MSATTIEWTDATWNPVTGCTKVSAGCKNCYAERIFARPYPGRSFTDVRTHTERLNYPLHWRKPKRIFVNSMSDLFHEDVTRDFIDAVWSTMAEARQHTFQILTKRPERMLEFMKDRTQKGWKANWRNIWLGVSVEDQPTADERIPLLLKTPAAVRFVSYEPALDSINFEAWFEQYPDHNGVRVVQNDVGIDWIIAGGESGPNARPALPDWFRSVRNQCAAAGVAFFFKQWGEWGPRIRTDGQASLPMNRVGKRAAGRELDGREHSEYPA